MHLDRIPFSGVLKRCIRQSLRLYVFFSVGGSFLGLRATFGKVSPPSPIFAVGTSLQACCLKTNEMFEFIIAACFLYWFQNRLEESQTWWCLNVFKHF